MNNESTAPMALYRDHTLKQKWQNQQTQILFISVAAATVILQAIEWMANIFGMLLTDG